jgi:hypothetical protein
MNHSLQVMIVIDVVQTTPLRDMMTEWGNASFSAALGDAGFRDQHRAGMVA